MRVVVGDVWIAGVAVSGLMLLTIVTASAAKPCLTQSEAQKRRPKAHLSWHTANHCWDNLPPNAASASDYDKPELQPTPGAPAQTVALPVAAEPEIIFPPVKHNNAEFFGLSPVPPLSWSVAWFMAAPITGWPLLLDIDQTPFITWERRIGR